MKMLYVTSQVPADGRVNAPPVTSTNVAEVVVCRSVIQVFSPYSQSGKDAAPPEARGFQESPS